MIAHVAILGVLMAAPAPAPVRVECDGAVDWVAGGPDGSRLDMSGGVRIVRGDLTLRARTARVEFDRGAEAPRTADVSGDVRVESSRFTLSAGVARMTRAAVPAGPGAVAIRAQVTAERSGDAWIELRSGDLVIMCAGPVTYDIESRTAVLAGGVRGQSPRMRVSASRATIAFAAPVPRVPRAAERPAEVSPAEGAPAAAAAGPVPPARDPDVERMELEGSVEIDILPVGEGPGIQARAPSATYAAEDGGVVTLTGVPPPAITRGGVVVTSQGPLRMFLKDGTLDAPGGRMKAVVLPPGDAP